VKGELSVKRGDAEGGVDMLRRALEALHADRYELLTTAFNSTLAEGLARIGRMDEALAVVDETIALVERSGEMFNLPELLRIKGEFLASTSAASQAAKIFSRALEVAAAQSALGWELRAATSLARMRGRNQDATRAALAGIHARFTEGFDTADLKAATDLLGEPRWRPRDT
jgi:predicted ATPase